MQTEARVGVVVDGGQRDGCGRKFVPKSQQQQSLQQQAQIGTVSQLLAGGIAGAVSKTCTAPLARLTILFQVQGMHSDVGTLKKACIWREASRVLHEEGIRAFWKGNLVTIAHRLPYSSVSFYSYERYKNLLQQVPGLESHRENISAHLLVRLVGGFMAGVTAATATYPLDLVRTRLAAQTNVIYYRGIWHTLHTISKDEGLFGLYKGLGATLLSVGPNIAISFSVYETLRSQWQLRRPQDSMALVSLACGSVSGIASSTGWKSLGIQDKTDEDIEEYPNFYQFIIDVPRFNSKDINVQVQDDTVLVIIGEKNIKEEKHGVTKMRINKFMRNFYLPKNVNIDTISAICRDGILTVVVEKLPPPQHKKPKIIHVKVD